MKNKLELIKKYLVFIIFIFSSCNQQLENRVKNQQIEIDNLKRENGQLKEADIYKSNRPSSINDGYDYGNSSNNMYFHLSDNQLNEAFKNYMSDSYFGFESYNVKGKTVLTP